MPVVPRLQQSLITEQATPKARVSTENDIAAFGGGSGQVTNAILGATGDVVEAYEAQVEKADKSKVNEAVTRSLNHKNEKLYGKAGKVKESNLAPGAAGPKDQTEASVGYLDYKGRDAIERMPELEKSWTDHLKESESGFTNERQKEMYKAKMASHTQSLNLNANRHAAREKGIYDNAQSEALVNAHINDATNNTYDQPALNKNLREIEETLRDFSIRNGLPKEEMNQKILEGKSKANIGVIETLVDADQDIRAKDYLKGLDKKGITASDRKRAEKFIEAASLKGRAQRGTDAIMAKGLTYEESLKKARATNDSKLEDEQVRRVKVRFNEQSEVQRAGQDALFNRSKAQVDAFLAKGERELVLSDVINTTDYADLSSEMKRSLMDLARNPINDDRTWIKFNHTSPKDLANLNQNEFMAKYYTKFNKTNRAKALSLWQQAVKDKREGKGAGSELSNNLSFTRRVEIGLRLSGIVNTDKKLGDLSKEEARIYAEYQSAASYEIEESEKSKGRKLTGNEKQEIINNISSENVLLKRSLLGFDVLWPDKTVKARFVKEEQKHEAFESVDILKTTDPEGLDRLKNMMRSNGVQATDERIGRAAGALKVGDFERYKRIITGRE